MNAKNLLILDSGDSLIGDRPPATTTKGKSSVEILNMLSYDAIALGLRDATLGVEELKQRIAEAKFPILSANLVISGTNDLLTEPYVIKSMGGHKIALIGLTDEGTRDKLQSSDPLETMLHVMPEVEMKADIVIVLSHAGWKVDKQIAQLVPNIDLILSGGMDKWDNPIVVQPHGTLLVRSEIPSPGHAGRYLSNVQLQFDSAGKLAKHKWTRVKLDPNVGDDAEVVEWTKKYR